MSDQRKCKNCRNFERKGPNWGYCKMQQFKTPRLGKWEGNSCNQFEPKNYEEGKLGRKSLQKHTS